MRVLTRIAGAVTVSMAAAALTVAVTPVAAHATDDFGGCPAGYVCIYPDASWNDGVPTLKFYTYGAHNLSNQFGKKRIFNNQTGTAGLRLCRGYNGTNCESENIQPMSYRDRDLTPINSIRLTP